MRLVSSTVVFSPANFSIWQKKYAIESQIFILFTLRSSCIIDWKTICTENSGKSMKNSQKISREFLKRHCFDTFYESNGAVGFSMSSWHHLRPDWETKLTCNFIWHFKWETQATQINAIYCIISNLWINFR